MALKIKPKLNIVELDDGNVVDNYSWTVSNKKIAREQCPRLILKEWQQTRSSVLQGINFFAHQAYSGYQAYKGFGKGPDGYNSLYAAVKTGNEYVLPYYNEYNHTVTNSWNRNKGIVGNSLDTFIVNPAKAIYANAGIETAKQWEGTSEALLMVSFRLLNTINPSVDIAKNYKLINALIYNNLLDRQNILVAAPPCIYEMKIPGIRNSPACVIREITVQNIGQVNRMDAPAGFEEIGGKIAIPDAWNIIIQIQELLTESRQIFAGVTDKSKVITSINESLERNIEDIVDSANDLKDRMENKAKPPTLTDLEQQSRTA